MESELVSGFMTEHAAVVFRFFFLAEYASILLICILTSVLFLGGYLFDSTLLENVIYYMCYYLLYLVEGIEYSTRIVINDLVYLKYMYLLVLKGEQCAMLYIMDRLSYGISWSEDIIYRDFSDKISFLKTMLSSKNPEYLIGNLLDQTFSGNPLVEGFKHSVVLGVKSCIMIFIFIWTRASYPRIRYDQLMSFCWTILLPLIIALIILFPCIFYSFNIVPNNIFLL